MDVYERGQSLDATQRSEDALLVEIQSELVRIRTMKREEKTLQNIIALQNSITKMLALCKYGREHLHTMRLRGVNRIRLTENEAVQVKQEIHDCLLESSSTQLLDIWQIGSKQ